MSRRCLRAPPWADARSMRRRAQGGSDRYARPSPERRSSHRLPIHERLAARSSILPVDTGNRRSRNDVLVLIPPCEHHKGRKGTNSRQPDHPPDMPDQRKPHERREKGADETSRAVPWHLNIGVIGLLSQLSMLDRPLLYAPVLILALDMRQHREVES